MTLKLHNSIPKDPYTKHLCEDKFVSAAKKNTMIERVWHWNQKAAGGGRARPRARLCQGLGLWNHNKMKFIHALRGRYSFVMKPNKRVLCVKTISAKSRRALFARPFFDKRVKAMERCAQYCKNPDKATLYSSQGQRLHNTKTNTITNTNTNLDIDSTKTRAKKNSGQG